MSDAKDVAPALPEARPACERLLAQADAYLQWWTVYVEPAFRKLNRLLHATDRLGRYSPLTETQESRELRVRILKAWEGQRESKIPERPVVHDLLPYLHGSIWNFGDRGETESAEDWRFMEEMIRLENFLSIQDERLCTEKFVEAAGVIRKRCEALRSRLIERLDSDSGDGEKTPEDLAAAEAASMAGANPRDGQRGAVESVTARRATPGRFHEEIPLPASYSDRAMFERDRWIYEKRQAGMKNPQVIEELQEICAERGWDPITTNEAVRRAVSRYCHGTGDPLLVDKGGRPRTRNRKTPK